MGPRFSKDTISDLAKRAGYLCSNPDCRVATVGPASGDSGTTMIGEAAHITGAKPSSARYRSNSNDALRRDVTNGIWLCRNCHKTVDSDEATYPENLLLHWREQHEHYVSERLGKPGAEARLRVQDDELTSFQDKPPLIRRLLIDKPIGWEWRFTAELLRFYNTDIFGKLDDLRDGHYLRSPSFLDASSAIVWIDQRVSEMSDIFTPVDGLLRRLTQGWGDPGEPADIQAIDRASQLIRDWLDQVLRFEETIKFARLPDEFQNLHELLADLVGSQAKKLEELPSELDALVEMISTDHGGTVEDPLIVNKTIVIELPEKWPECFNREYRRVTGEHFGLVEEETKRMARPFAWLYFLIFFFVAFFGCFLIVRRCSVKSLTRSGRLTGAIPNETFDFRNQRSGSRTFRTFQVGGESPLLVF